MQQSMWDYQIFFAYVFRKGITFYKAISLKPQKYERWVRIKVNILHHGDNLRNVTKCFFQASDYDECLVT
jgi:hypothetical protein